MHRRGRIAHQHVNWQTVFLFEHLDDGAAVWVCDVELHPPPVFFAVTLNLGGKLRRLGGAARCGNNVVALRLGVPCEGEAETRGAAGDEPPQWTRGRRECPGGHA